MFENLFHAHKVQPAQTSALREGSTRAQIKQYDPRRACVVPPPPSPNKEKNHEAFTQTGSMRD